MSAGLTTFRVVYAVMLRDLRTRFFGHGLGYLIAIAFPLLHVIILVSIYSFLGRAAPFGREATLFFATGIAPFMAWMYMSRYVMLGGVMNKPLLTFPGVTIMDLFLGRGLLEALGACLSVMVLIGIGLAIGLEIRPSDPTEAALAFLVAMGLGLGWGVFNGVIAMLAPGWVTVTMLLQIILYFGSGILFLPAQLPGYVLDILYWLPTLHIVEWMRAAWFEGYPEVVLDRRYAVVWVFASICFAFALERVMRRRLLER